MERSLLSKTQFFLICFVIAFSVMAYGTVHQPTISIVYLLIAVMVVLWTVDCFKRREVIISTHWIQIPLYAFAVYAMIQVIPFGYFQDAAGVNDVPRTISLASFYTKLTAFHILAMALFLSLSLIYLNSASRIRRLVNFLIIFGLAYGFFAIIQYIISPTKIFGVYERENPFGTFVNRHNFAAAIELLIMLPIGMLLGGSVRRDQKLFYITASAIMGLSLLMSGSRGGLLAVIAGFAVLVLMAARLRGKRDTLLKIAAVSILGAAIVGGSIFIGGETTFTRIADTAASKDVTTDRSEIWATTIKVITHDLPFGAGIGAFAQAYTPFDPHNGLDRVEQAHNDYLQVLADAGIPGALIGLGFLFIVFLISRNAMKEDNLFRRGIAAGAAAGIISVLVHSMFDFVLHTTAVTLLFLLFLAIAAACERKFRDDVKNGDDGRRRKKSSSSNVTPITGRVRIAGKDA